MQIAEAWRVSGGAIDFCRWRADRVERLALPDLTELTPLPDAEGRATGLLGGA